MVQDERGHGWAARSTSGSLRQSPGLLKSRQEPLGAGLFRQAPEWSKPPTRPFLLEKLAVGTGETLLKNWGRERAGHTLEEQQTHEENVPFRTRPLAPSLRSSPPRPLSTCHRMTYLSVDLSPLPGTEAPRGPGLHYRSPVHAEQSWMLHYLFAERPSISRANGDLCGV